MQFEHPYALLLLLVIPGLYVLYVTHNTKKRESVLKFSSLLSINKAAAGRTSFARRHLPFVIMMTAVGSAVIALADPQIPYVSSQIVETNGRNISIVLDGSESMSATDYEPTRLDAAKQAIINLIEEVEARDYLGVVLFETGAITISYLTDDREKTVNAVTSIRQGTGPTAIGDGLALGVDMVRSIPDRGGVVILLSDGVHNSGLIMPEEAAAYAKVAGIPVHTVGMGSVEPVFLKNDVFGEPQYAELDEGTLAYIANETGGVFFKSIDEQTLGDIFGEIKVELEYKTEYEGMGDWFVLAVIVLLVTGAYVMYGRYRIIA